MSARIRADLSLMIDASGLVSASMAAVSPGARLILLALIGILLVVLGVLVAMAVLVRRRGQVRAPDPRTTAMRSAALVRGSAASPPPLRTSPRMGSSGMVEEVATAAERVACPTCGQEFDAALRYCPADARELVALADLAERARAGSSACATCHRAFEVGVRYCPHDASELVPIAVYEATRGKVGHLVPEGVAGRICPHCRVRVDLAARFCPHDGTELSLLH